MNIVKFILEQSIIWQRHSEMTLVWASLGSFEKTFFRGAGEKKTFNKGKKF